VHLFIRDRYLQQLCLPGLVQLQQIFLDGNRVLVRDGLLPIISSDVSVCRGCRRNNGQWWIGPVCRK
jgi:hypothetical protein